MKAYSDETRNGGSRPVTDSTVQSMEDFELSEREEAVAMSEVKN